MRNWGYSLSSALLASAFAATVATGCGSSAPSLPAPTLQSQGPAKGLGSDVRAAASNGTSITGQAGATGASGAQQAEARPAAEAPITAIPLRPDATAACPKCVIVGFKPPTVTLFLSPTGQEAQRVPRSALPVPIIATTSSASDDRLQIMTLDGVRWVAASEVQVGGG